MKDEATEKIELPPVIDAPNYSTLLSWWDDWPEARPTHLDFWARGNFIRRIISRSNTKRTAGIVRVEYIDEIEAALRRLALLDIDARTSFALERYMTSGYNPIVKFSRRTLVPRRVIEKIRRVEECMDIAVNIARALLKTDW